MQPRIGPILVELRIQETRPPSITVLSVVMLFFASLGFLASALVPFLGFTVYLIMFLSTMGFVQTPVTGSDWLVAIPVALLQGLSAFQILVAIRLRSARNWARVVTLIVLGSLTFLDGGALLAVSMVPAFAAAPTDASWVLALAACFVLLTIHGAVLLILLGSPVKHWFREAKRLRALPSHEQVQIMQNEFIAKIPATFALILSLCTLATGTEPTFQRESIFPAEHDKHNHASCVVELPGGDLLVAWYNGTGEREADDVRILGSRLNKSTGKRTPPFLLADTPGYPDCNPALFAAPDRTLWLFWPTILDHRWEGALLKFATTDTPPDGRGPARWQHEGVLHITPTGFDKAMSDALGTLNGAQLTLAHSYFEKLGERSKDELYQRLGWMPRVHPTVLPSGRWLLPLYSDTFSASIVAISDDRGASWVASRPIIGFGNIQPSLVRKDDGTLVAYMRENGPRKRIRVSTSKDEGVTWSPVVDSTLPNPGAGIEALRLANGHWLMIYNDSVKGRHTLAVSLSDDEGTTWPVTRHVATGAVGDEQFHYPSIIQTTDGLIHTTFTNSGKSRGSTIDHAVFPESWIREGGAKTN